MDMPCSRGSLLRPQSPEAPPEESSTALAQRSYRAWLDTCESTGQARVYKFHYVEKVDSEECSKGNEPQTQDGSSRAVARRHSWPRFNPVNDLSEEDQFHEYVKLFMRYRLDTFPQDFDDFLQGRGLFRFMGSHPTQEPLASDTDEKCSTTKATRSSSYGSTDDKFLAPKEDPSPPTLLTTPKPVSLERDSKKPVGMDEDRPASPKFNLELMLKGHRRRTYSNMADAGMSVRSTSPPQTCLARQGKLSSHHRRARDNRLAKQVQNAMARRDVHDEVRGGANKALRMKVAWAEVTGQLGSKKLDAYMLRKRLAWAAKPCDSPLKWEFKLPDEETVESDGAETKRVPRDPSRLDYWYDSE